MQTRVTQYVIIFSVQGRQCSEDCEVGDTKLRIPKGATITADVWSVHYDKTIWGDNAEQFVPERYVFVHMELS
jgi:cytochrome P450